MKKAKQAAIVFFAIAFFAFPAYAQIYLGTVDGYVFYMNNSLVTSASVSAAVSGCSGSGCSGLVLSQSNGYYVIANLNLPVGGTITVNAVKENASGSNSGTADSFQAAKSPDSRDSTRNKGSLARQPCPEFRLFLLSQGRQRTATGERESAQEATLSTVGNQRTRGGLPWPAFR